MAFERTLFAALAAAPLVTGHPGSLKNAESCGKGVYGETMVSDSEIESAVCVTEIVTWDDKNNVTTSTQKVSYLPLSFAPEYATGSVQWSSESTVTKTMPSFLTITVAVPSASHPTSASPVTAVTHTSSVSQVSIQSEISSELFGISYAPYRATHECKSQQDIDQDMEQMAGKYSFIRIYGTDCEQVPKMYKAAKSKGMKLFLGIWQPSNVENEASKIIAAVNGDWDMVHTVSVGNERVNNGQASPGEIIEAVKFARNMLRAAGFKGPVVTVDTFMAVLAHPELCEASDYCAFNAHPFFDSTATASQAGRWLVETIDHVKSTLQTSRRIIVTETGWPTRGMANGLAVPGLANQKMALDSIRSTFASARGDIILFSAFNDLWKPKTGVTFDADQFWGINGAMAQCDQSSDGV